ncbi:MAG TPA: HU family DNA-binding protein [Desulfocapsa sulfexigens]|nr:HU family DNA-binding protein [Desulfocapsa sulfexigens]
MNKKDIIEAVADQARISPTQAKVAVETMTATIKKGLKTDHRVALVGFGSFSVKKRAARNGRNPQTGEVIKIKARKVVKFNPGQPLKDAAN